MATGTIKQPTMIKNITGVYGSGTGTVSSANGYANVDVTFNNIPDGSVYMCETIEAVGASVSSNDIHTLVRITRGDSSSRYRVVSGTAQNIVVTAIRLYKTTS